MINLSTAIDYLSPLWMALDDIEDDLPEFTEGDLIEYDSIDGAIGAGIIKAFTFYDGRPAAIIVPANNTSKWLDYAYLTDIDPLSLDHYTHIYQETYGQLPQVSHMQLRREIATRMSAYSRIGGYGSLPQVQEYKATLSHPVRTQYGQGA